jgi:NAD(P)-dependent dehydrogenase (short-subunit alcohol dehydrogenase family)
MYGVTGTKSTIAQEFTALCTLDGQPVVEASIDDMPRDLDSYLICTGFLAGKDLVHISDEDAARTWELNFLKPARFADEVFQFNPKARICIIGSESGFAGSFDMAYAGAKAALHLYIQQKKLAGDQLLIGLAPHIIWDTRMTQSRSDLEVLAKRGEGNRLGRWLSALEVAREAYGLLQGSPSLSGTVVRMRAQ